MALDIENDIQELRAEYRNLQKEVSENKLETSIKLAEIQGDTSKIREMLEKDYKNLTARVEKLEGIKDKLVWSIISAILISLLSLVVVGVK